MSRVVFIFEAGKHLGVGHAMRCLTLADRLAAFGWQVQLAGFGETGPIVDDLSLGRFGNFFKLDDVDPTPLGGGWQWLVVDHYGLSQPFEKHARQIAQNLLAIDDLADRDHEVDLLLDMTLGRRAEDYGSRVRSDTKMLLGPQYALIKPAYLKPVADRSDPKLQRLFVSLGGADPDNVTAKILLALAGSGLDLQVDVVLTRWMQHAATVQTLAMSLPWVKIHRDLPDLATLMDQADLAIGAGGGTSWERCARGLPTLLVEIADNQRDVIAGLAAAGAAMSLGRPDSQMADRLIQLLREFRQNPARLQQLSAQALKICDGFGSSRVICAMAGEVITPRGVTVRLEPMEHRDEETLFRWQQKQEIRQFARNPLPPTYDEHRQWFRTRLGDPSRLLAKVMLGDQAVGMARLDPRGETGGFEVSILIDPHVWGQGLAKGALSLLRKIAAKSELHAFVQPQNQSSLALFAAAGYQPVGQDWYLSRGQN